MDELEQDLKDRNFDNRLKKLRKILKNKKIIFYGTGKFFKEIIKNYDLSFVDAIGISDIKYLLKEENEIDLGYKIIPSEKILDYKPDIVVVSTRFYDSTIKYLKFLFKNTKIKIIPLAKYSFKEVVLKPFKHKKPEFEPDFFNKYVDITNLPKAKGEERQIQLRIFELLKQIKQIAKENNLSYWLCSGTLLGAVRHKGFIPWDNDIDICMLRDDFSKTLDILKYFFKDSEFIVRERAQLDNNYQIRIINRKDTRIALDIFPVDFYFKNNLSNEEKIYLTNRIKKARKIFKKLYPVGFKTQEEIIEAKQNLIKIRDEYILENKSKIEKGALFYALDYPYTLAKLLCVDYETVFPLKEIVFEDEVFTCPNDTNKYLKNLYGDYMSFPSIK